MLLAVFAFDHLVLHFGSYNKCGNYTVSSFVVIFIYRKNLRYSWYKNEIKKNDVVLRFLNRLRSYAEHWDQLSISLNLWLLLST